MLTASDCRRFCKSNRWTESAIDAFLVAENKSRDCNHVYIGTDALLWGLFANTNSAFTLANACQRNVVPPVLDELSKLLDPRDKVASGSRSYDPLLFPPDELSVVPRVRDALTKANELAATTYRRYGSAVHCLHLLIAIAVDETSVASLVLSSFGLSCDKLSAASLGVKGDHGNFATHNGG